LGYVEIRDAYVANLAFRYELPHGLGRFLERRARIGPVELVEINVVYSQVSQALFDALAQPSDACVGQQLAAFHPQPALGGQDHLVSPVGL